MGDGLLAESTLYFGTASILAVATVVFGVLGLRESGYRRFMLVLGAVPAGAMAVAYVLMGTGSFTVTVTAAEREQSVARFFAYTAVLLIVPFVLRELVGLSKRQYAFVTAFLLLMPWLALVSWLVEGVASTAASAGAIVAYLLAGYLLYGPYARIAREASGQRQLLYIKICHLAILCYGALILTSGLSEQAAGILDFFVGQFVASFADVVFMLAFGGLLYYSRTVFHRPAGDGSDEQHVIESSESRS